MDQSRENLRTDERMDGQTLFYSTHPAEAEGLIISLQQTTVEIRQILFEIEC